MDLPPLEPGRLIQRLNRFAASVDLGGDVVRAHVANSGRLAELLVSGAEVHLARADRPGRLTTHDLLLVRHGRELVSIDSRAPAALAAETLLAEGLSPIPRAEVVRREVPLGRHRVDLAALAGGTEWLIEVKGCTLVEGGTALFPDAPTVRGTQQVEELARRAAKGACALVLFVVQRADARRFRPYAEHDPRFAEALADARASGVVVVARSCRVTLRRVTLSGQLEYGNDE